MISLSLRVKPELGFTSFRTVLQCYLTDKASSRHPTKKNNVPTPTPAPRSQFPPSCPLPHPQHLSPYCMLYIYLYNVWQMLFSKMATRFPIPRTFFFTIWYFYCPLWEMFFTPIESSPACDCDGSDTIWPLRLGHKKPHNLSLVLLEHAILELSHYDMRKPRPHGKANNQLFWPSAPAAVQANSQPTSRHSRKLLRWLQLQPLCEMPSEHGLA